MAEEKADFPQPYNSIFKARLEHKSLSHVWLVLLFSDFSKLLTPILRFKYWRPRLLCVSSMASWAPPVSHALIFLSFLALSATI